ncbi:MAG: right-handed parallel beta-helix repeat-containing protein [Methanobrevibacter sp.]|jgi:parallel beta-helix repeat protein|nr:right-handed parallel beta-helix repeat-containing protein [Candidatus Methanovirga procula]
MLKKKLSHLRGKCILGCWIIYLLLFSLIPMNVLGHDALYENRDGKIINLHPGDSIEEAVDNAKDGDTILLDGGDYKTSSGIIAKSITLKASGVGGNPILSKRPTNKGTIITLNGANFKLEGLTINGCNVSNGILIRNQANATINNCNITNATNSMGGGVYVSNSNVNISGCNIVDNKVSDNGAGVYIDNYDGRNVYNVSINHCRFYNNKASNNNFDSYDDVFVKELHDMDGNSLKDSINLDHNWWGSNTVNSTQTNVVPNDHYSTVLYLNNNITTDNTSVGFIDGSNVNIGYDLVLNTTNRTDNNNLLPYFSVKHNFINESIIKDGREPYNFQCEAKYLFNQSFESVVDNQCLKIIIFSNTVDSIKELIDEAEPNTVIELPDGIYNKGSKDDSIRDCNLIITKPLTIKSKDDGHPVIDLTGKNDNGFKILSDNVRLEGLTIKGANFNGDGGAILSLGADNTIIKNCTLVNNKVLGDGGGIAILSGNNATIDNCTVVNNAAVNGAGIHMMGGGINNVITNSNVLNNKATDFGGGICLFFSAFVNIARSNIINNSAYRGGGFFISSNNVSNVNYNRILNNKNSWFEEGEDFYGEGLINLDFNWWGANDLTTKQTNHIPEHYFIVNSSTNKSNNTLNYVFNTNDNYPNNKSLLPYFDGFCILSDKNFSFDARNNQIFDLHQRDKVSIKVDNYEYNYTDPFESLSDIYVAFNGSNDNLGGINNPVANVNYAMNIVKPNGTIHLLTDLSITETINVTKNVKIKSDKGN